MFPKDDKGNIIFSDVDYVDTWSAMEKLVENKYVRSIGLSNFNKKQIERILDICFIRPVNNQVYIFNVITVYLPKFFVIFDVG